MRRTDHLAGEVTIILVIKRWRSNVLKTGIGGGTTTGNETTKEIDDATIGAIVLTGTGMIPGGEERTDIPSL
jgi:hypothetical protein